MKLLRLKADGFGSLRAEYRFAPDRLTLWVDDNERGKSTLLAAVAAGLYGLENDRRTHRVITPYERWRPWDGGSYRVELELEAEGERYTVTRDFDRGTVEVWNDRGQELTHDFREGKDEYPVGRKLLGLDADEFERCAFLRQGELEHVVPDEERSRRVSTLHARLESAADTRIGDTNATEALRVLEQAAAAYTCPELDTTLKVENAIQRLEGKRGVLESEIQAHEFDLEQASGPLEELARLGEEEAKARDALVATEAARLGARAAEIRGRLEADDRRRAELQRLEAEAAALADVPRIAPEAESRLRDAVGRCAEAEHTLETLGARRRQANEERERHEIEVQGLDLYESYSLADADRLTVQAEEIRRLGREHQELHAEFEASREEMAARGYEMDRADLLDARFGSLSPEDQQFLRTHAERALALKNEVAATEKARGECHEALRAVQARKHLRRIPGWLVLVLGFGGAIAASVAGARDPAVPWIPLSSLGLLVAAAGLTILLQVSRGTRADLEEAERRLAAADERLHRVRFQRSDHDRRLETLANRMNYAQPEWLLREWSDYGRLVEERGPVQRTQQQIASLERQRQQLFEESQKLLEPAGGGPADPAYLELTAAGIRQFHTARQRLAEFEKSWRWIDEAQRNAALKVEEIRGEAARILESAGMIHNPERPLADHLDDLAACAQSAVRLSLLTDTLIPQAAGVILDDQARADLEARLAQLDPQADSHSQPPPAASTGEHEAELSRLREAIDGLVTRRNELRLQFEHEWRRCRDGIAARRPELVTVERALARAVRFKQSVDLARETIQRVALDTHRRWADFLNQRAIEILESLGTGIRQLRFGEDLDFSVKLPSGQQVSRGKALLQLSYGARDQLYLAVRLAISEYLSNGRPPLPLLADDCFATSDDQRTRAGMKALIELSGRHQVILVTCHRQRVEALAAMDPELYATRVHRLEADAVGSQA